MADSQTVYEDESKEFDKNTLANISKSRTKSQKFGLLWDIVTTENDLAGFSLAWTAGFLIILVLRISQHEDVKDALWWWIFLIPISISSLTWIFSYIITIYRKPNSKESMKIPAFILPFLCKIFIASLLFWRLFYSFGGIMDRSKDKAHYTGWCDCSVFVVWISLVLSSITTEIIITTTMINSSQNLRAKIPKKVDVFLFVTRPTLWVYNRLIVMFLTFYCYFYVFGIGPLCTNQCRVKDVSSLQSIGVSILILPFRDILYLFKWEPFYLSQYSDPKEVVYAVIQQVLIFTTILDLVMDIWSVSQIFKRIEVDAIRSNLVNSIRGFKPEQFQQPIAAAGASPATPSENETGMQAEMEKLNNIKEGPGDDNDIPKFSTVPSASVASQNGNKYSRDKVKPALSVIDSKYAE